MRLVCNVLLKVISFPSRFAPTPRHRPPNLPLGFPPLFSLLVGSDGGRSSARRCVCAACLPPSAASRDCKCVCVCVCWSSTSLCRCAKRLIAGRRAAAAPLISLLFKSATKEIRHIYMLFCLPDSNQSVSPHVFSKTFAANFKEHKASRVYTEIHKRRINIEIKKTTSPAHHQPSLHVHQSNLSEIDLKPLPLSFPLRL